MTNFLLSQCSSHKNSTEYTNFCWIKVPSSSPLQLSWLLCVMYQINNYPPIFIGTNRTTGVPWSSNALHISHALYIFYHWESFDMECRMGWLLCDCCVGNKIRCLCIFHMSACLGWIGGVISTNEMYSRIPYILDNNGSVIPIFLWYAMPRSNDRKFDVISVY